MSVFEGKISLLGEPMNEGGVMPRGGGLEPRKVV